MNIVVVNGYVRENKGDAALMSVLCHGLTKTFKNAEICVASMEDPEALSHFEEFRNIGSLRRYVGDESISKVRRILRKTMIVGLGAVWGLGPKKLWQQVVEILPKEFAAELKALQKADVVVSMGGGYLNGKDSIDYDLNVLFLLMPIWIANRLRKRVIYAPQSIGPFGTKFQLRLVQQVLPKVDAIFVREQVSKDILADLGIQKNVVQSIDAGFLFASKAKIDGKKVFGSTPGQLTLGITVRNWLEPVKQQAYEQAVAAAADHFVEKYDGRVIFIPQVTSRFQKDDDRFVSKSVFKEMKHKEAAVVIEDDLDHYATKSLYEQLDFIIGTRFHSVIFSLTSYVPAVAIEYEHKTGGIMADLDLSNRVVKIESVTKELLITKLDEIVAEKDTYKQHLHAVLPGYQAKAEAAFDAMKVAVKL